MTDRLALAGVLGFGLGILGYVAFPLGWPLAAYAAFLALLSLALWLPRRLPVFLIACIFLMGAALGAGRAALAPSTLPEAFAPLIETRTALEGVIVVDPDIRETQQRLTLEVAREDTKTRVLVVALRFPEVRYGERIRAEGTLELPESFETGEGRLFAYDKFLAKDGVFALMQNARIEVIGGREGWYRHARGALSDLKFSGIDALGAALPEPHASLASGLILGGKQGLGETLLDDFIVSGLIHIVVLSGYNVMIIADAVMKLFGSFSSGAAAWLGAITIGAFVLAAGAGPASIRAGIMAAIALYARATGRTYAALRALILAGVLMLLWNPLTLPYDPGFQLSFIATLGLIFGTPITERWFPWIEKGFMREIAASTVAAQIAVLPLLLYQNGLFSLVALPANLLVLPVVPFAMLLSFIAMLAGAFVPVAASAIGFPAYTVLSYIVGMVEFFAGLPLASFSLPAFPFALAVLAYAALGWGLYRLSRSTTLSPRTASRKSPSSR